MRPVLAALSLGLALALGYLFVAPTPVEPVAWQPTPAVAAEGVWAPNTRLAAVETWATPGMHGPEDVAVGADGSVYAGVVEGSLLKWASSGTGPTVFAQTGGRPVGLDVAADGTLVVADAYRGLLAVSPEGHVTVWMDEVQGTPVHFADDLEVAPDGVVWLSDATDRFPFHAWKLDIVESGAHGRLLSYDPATGEGRVRLEGLHFANGVAVSADNTFVLVVETSRYRVRRLWISGPRAGQDEVWVEGLPGFPDGISRAPDGTFWLAIPSPRNALLDAAAGAPWVRKVIARLPAALQPAPERHGRVVHLDAEGRVLDVLDDPGGTFAVVTSAQEVAGMLWLGSLGESAIARLPVP